MLTLEYLQSILFKKEEVNVGGHPVGRAVNPQPQHPEPLVVLKPEVNGLNDPKQIIESAAGYDGIVALIQTKGLSPVVVLENSEVGEFSFRPGGFQKSSQSIWVMKMAPRDGDRKAVQDDCFGMMKRIISVFNLHEKDEPLAQWEWDHIPWGIRNAGPNFTGYEFTLYFGEDTDFEYKPLE